MIQAPNELRDVCVGATVNLFVSVGQTSRRLKGSVEATRECGTGDEVLEVHVSESTPGDSEIVFWLGFTDEQTFLLPLDSEEGNLVYVRYKHSGGQTGLYIDRVRDVGVRSPSEEGGDEDGDRASTGQSPTNEPSGISRPPRSEQNSRL